MTVPIVSIIYEDGRWRAHAPALPALQVSSITLWSLLTVMADRVTVETEQAYKDLAAQGRVGPLIAEERGTK